VQQFGCMASVGATGCGFEHQLESVYAALRNNVENAGFLRSDALLAVVFLTNEDDGSAPPTTHIYESGADTAIYGFYDTYRQTRFGVFCGGQPIPYADPDFNGLPQLLSNCAPEPNPMLAVDVEYDVARYTALLSQPAAKGGVKASPDDVLLVAIDGPESPMQTIMADTSSGLGLAPNPAYVTCGPALKSGCALRLQHSCQNSASPGFFADPPVRLNTVVRSAPHNQIFSICGDDLAQTPDYTAALTATADLARGRILGNCVPTKLASVSDPDCQVAQTVGGATTYLPRCDRGAAPCWTLQAQASCGPASPDGQTIVITRTDAPPAGASVSAWCKTP
jgi:hypothetical protein